MSEGAALTCLQLIFAVEMQPPWKALYLPGIFTVWIFVRNPYTLTELAF
jgi:hypothetical protein